MIALLAILCFGEVLRESDPRIEYNFTDPDCLIWIDGECKVKTGDGPTTLWHSDTGGCLSTDQTYYYTPCYDYLITKEETKYDSRNYVYLYQYIPNPDLSLHCYNQSVIRVHYAGWNGAAGVFFYEPEGNKNMAVRGKKDCVVWFPRQSPIGCRTNTPHSCAVTYAQKDQKKELTYTYNLYNHYFDYDPNGECLFYFRNREICLMQNPNRIPPTLAFTYNGALWNYHRPRTVIKIIGELFTDFLL